MEDSLHCCFTDVVSFKVSSFQSVTLCLVLSEGPSFGQQRYLSELSVSGGRRGGPDLPAWARRRAFVRVTAFTVDMTSRSRPGPPCFEDGQGTPSRSPATIDLRCMGFSSLVLTMVAEASWRISPWRRWAERSAALGASTVLNDHDSSD